MKFQRKMEAVPLSSPAPPPPKKNLGCVAGTEKGRGRGKAQKGKGRGQFPSFPNPLSLHPPLPIRAGYSQQVVITIGLLTMKRSESRHIGMAGQLCIYVF